MTYFAMKMQTPDDRAATWVRAPEEQRCRAKMEWPAFTAIGVVRCDHEKGHAGSHGYLTVAGAVVEWSSR